jgi:hypothetical protein
MPLNAWFQFLFISSITRYGFNSVTLVASRDEYLVAKPFSNHRAAGEPTSDRLVKKQQKYRASTAFLIFNIYLETPNHSSYMYLNNTTKGTKIFNLVIDYLIP